MPPTKKNLAKKASKKVDQTKGGELVHVSFYMKAEYQDNFQKVINKNHQDRTKRLNFLIEKDIAENS